MLEAQQRGHRRLSGQLPGATVTRKPLVQSTEVNSLLGERPLCCRSGSFFGGRVPGAHMKDQSQKGPSNSHMAKRLTKNHHPLDEFR